jgi:hypothetical protein
MDFDIPSQRVNILRPLRFFTSKALTPHQLFPPSSQTQSLKSEQHIPQSHPTPQPTQPLQAPKETIARNNVNNKTNTNALPNLRKIKINHPKQPRNNNIIPCLYRQNSSDYNPTRPFGALGTPPFPHSNTLEESNLIRDADTCPFNNKHP